MAKHKVILSAAPNGARKLKKDHPNIPLTAREIAKEAENCLKVGCSLFHLHVRNKDGSHSLSPNLYKDAISAIKDRVESNLILQVTTEAVGIYKAQEQMETVTELCPEAVSLAIRELCPDKEHEPSFQQFMEWVRANEVLPQFIIYDIADMKRFMDLQKRGIIFEAKHQLLFVLGRYEAEETAVDSLFMEFLSYYQHDILPFLCAFGKNEHKYCLKSVLKNGHVRLGFENNLFLKNGVLAESTAHILSQFRESLEQKGIDIMTTDVTRITLRNAAGY